MKCRTTPICLILVLVLVLGLCPVTGASAGGGDLTAEKDSSSSYKPTEIVNGHFATTPFMGFVYNGTSYTTYNQAQGLNTTNYISSSIPNGVNGGWNTTENRLLYNTLFEYNKGSGYGLTKEHFIEMNAWNSAVFYQDLTTYGGDVIRWTLQHAVRKDYGGDPQTMRVEIGAPNYSDGKIVAASGVNASVNSQIQQDTMGKYESSGVTQGAGKVAFANEAELVNLSVAKSTFGTWKDVAGVYVVPDGQSVTRFAFIATTSTTPDGGNLLDDITFSTLIGNLSISGDSNDNAVVKGYWGDTDASKSLVIEIGSDKYEVDMSAVCPGNFSITIPSEKLGDAESITVYHEDYSSASRSMDLHQHTLVYEADGATLSAYCSNTFMASKCSIQEANKVSITVSAASKEYDGTAVTATLSDTTDWVKDIGEVPTIVYYKESSTSGNSLMKLLFATAFAEEKLDSAPSDVGNYTARISAGDATAKVAFSITKQAADAPTGLVGVPPTSSKAEDGYIDGVDDTMEYSTDGGQTWTPVPEETTTLTDLGEGSYWVRYKETDTVEASDPVKLDLKAKSPADAVPKTGDNSNIMLYAAALLLSTICAFILLQRKRSR